MRSPGEGIVMTSTRNRSTDEARRYDRVDISTALMAIQGNNHFMELFQSMSEAEIALHYVSDKISKSGEDSTNAVLDFVFKACGPTASQEKIDRRVSISVSDEFREDMGTDESKVIEMDRRVMRAFTDYKQWLPFSIWTCCKRGCFALLADRDELFVFDKVMRIHEIAKAYHERIVDVSDLIQSQRKGVGGSHIGFVPPTRADREPNCVEWSAKCVLKQFAICLVYQGTISIAESVYLHYNNLKKMRLLTAYWTILGLEWDSIGELDLEQNSLLSMTSFCILVDVMFPAFVMPR